MTRRPIAPRVLLINCSEDEREMYADYLRFDGVSTVEACEPADAEAKAVRLRPDVVLTALGLPAEENGLDLIRRLRGTEALRHTTIVVVSGRVFPDEQQRAFAAGCDVFLPKPLLPDVLAHEVRRAFAARRRAEFAADSTRRPPAE